MFIGFPDLSDSAYGQLTLPSCRAMAAQAHALTSINTDLRLTNDNPPCMIYYGLKELCVQVLSGLCMIYEYLDG